MLFVLIVQFGYDDKDMDTWFLAVHALYLSTVKERVANFVEEQQKSKHKRRQGFWDADDQAQELLDRSILPNGQTCALRKIDIILGKHISALSSILK